MTKSKSGEKYLNIHSEMQESNVFWLCLTWWIDALNNSDICFYSWRSKECKKTCNESVLEIIKNKQKYQQWIGWNAFNLEKNTYSYNHLAADDPCTPNPCQNSGVCNQSGTSYTCTCQTGWIGLTCSTGMTEMSFTLF
jgi:hypothetical protein